MPALVPVLASFILRRGTGFDAEALLRELGGEATGGFPAALVAIECQDDRFYLRGQPFDLERCSDQRDHLVGSKAGSEQCQAVEGALDEDNVVGELIERGAEPSGRIGLDPAPGTGRLF